MGTYVGGRGNLEDLFIVVYAHAMAHMWRVGAALTSRFSPSSVPWALGEQSQAHTADVLAHGATSPAQEQWF